MTPEQMQREQLVYEVNRLRECMGIANRDADRLRQEVDSLRQSTDDGRCPRPNTVGWWRWHYAGRLAPVALGFILNRIQDSAVDESEGQHAAREALDTALSWADGIIERLQKGGGQKAAAAATYNGGTESGR